MSTTTPTTTRRPTYIVVRLTGATLVDATGRATGMESAGVISRHRSRAAAERQARYLSSDAMGRILCEVRSV